MRKRYEISHFSLMEPEAAAAHLAAMAERGWLLEHAGQWLWRYRRIEPRTLRFSISYFPDASVFDAEPTEEQRQYFTYCEAAGWRLAATWFQALIFYTDLRDPIPLETDEAARLENIRRTMRKHFIAPMTALLTALLVLDAFRIWIAWDSPHYLLDSNIALTALLMMTAATVSIVFSLLRWRLWFVRSRRAVAAGGECVRLTARFRRLSGIVVCILLLLLAAALIADADNGNISLAAVLRILIWGGCLTALHLLMQLLKRLGWERGAIRTTFLISAVVVSLLFAHFAPVINPVQVLPVSELPLSIEDLGWEQTNADFSMVEQSRSILLERLDVYQPDQIHHLSYTRYVTDLDWVYGLCLRETLKTGPDWAESDASLWGAERAYYWGTMRDGHYVLCYDGVLLAVDYYGALPDLSQIRTTVERLLP